VPADFALLTWTKMLPVRGVAGRQEPLAATADIADEPSQVRHSARLTPVTAIIAVATLLALGLRLYQLGRPGYLLSVTEYDDGPYFGSAVRLVNGSIPYRDFLVVQPPGITLLMTPAALLGKVTGTDWAIAVGRLLTAFASVACVTLTGLLARHRGVLAAVVACGIPAVFPDSVQAAHTVLVEPWLAMFCLAGALAVFEGDRLTISRRRLAWGGVAFGFAGAVEVWAIFPMAVIAVLSLRSSRRVAVYLAGAAAGFLIPVLPFAAIAPRGIYQGLVVAQVGSRVDATRVPNWYRLQEMAGLTDFQVTHSTAVVGAALVGALVLGMLCLASAVTRQPPTSLEWFAVGSTTLVATAFMWPNQFHYHFAAFLAPFLALAIALPAGRLVQDARRGTAAHWPRWCAVGAAGLAITAMAVVQAHSESNLQPHVSYATIVAVRRLIPAGACVVTDQVSLTIVADRFVSDVPGCPVLVDSIGTDYALSHGRNPETGAAKFPALVAVWRSALDRAQYVVLSGRQSLRVPWNPGLSAYFRHHFTQIMGNGGGSAVYRRTGLPSP
jgi:alpha-1,2-mannosyltransferase